jgi:hypothetical protein
MKMNYCKMFRDAGIMDNDANFIKQSYFDIDNNCKNSLEALFGLIGDVYTFNDFTTDLYDFSIELKNLYTEVGVKMGCLFIERHFDKEIRLNFCDTDKLEMKNILILKSYLDILSYRIVDIMIKTDIENLFSGLKNKISLLQHELVVEYGVPDEAINFVLNSDEFMKLSYFLIKTGFKSGLFWCLSYNAYIQSSEGIGNYLPAKWPIQLI